MGEPGTHCLCMPEQFRYILHIISFGVIHKLNLQIITRRNICDKDKLSSIKKLVEFLDPVTHATPISTVCRLIIPVTALSTMVIGVTTPSLVLY